MQKKSNKITIGILVGILIITAIVVVTKNVNTTLKKDLRDFAVKDTANIDKIFMADKAGASVTLVRQADGNWKLNEKYLARPDAIKTLLTTINRVSIKAPLAKAAFNNIVKSLAAKSVKVEIYQKGELVKTYYVGGPTPDNTGTYMMLENSATPFITEIAGFEGYLSTRYFTSEAEWRDKTIFALTPPEIRNIKVEYHEMPENSFEITNKGNNMYEVKALKYNDKLITYDSLALKQYLSLFQRLSFEALITTMPKERVDSILNSPPMLSVSVTDMKGNTTGLKAFRRPASPNTVDELGNPKKYDVDRLYAYVDNKYLCLIQFFVFDPVFKPVRYFEMDPALVKK